MSEPIENLVILDDQIWILIKSIFRSVIVFLDVIVNQVVFQYKLYKVWKTRAERLENLFSNVFVRVHLSPPPSCLESDPMDKIVSSIVPRFSCTWRRSNNFPFPAVEEIWFCALTWEVRVFSVRRMEQLLLSYLLCSKIKLLSTFSWKLLRFHYWRGISERVGSALSTFSSSVHGKETGIFWIKELLSRVEE